MKALLGGTLLKRRVNSSRWIYLVCGILLLVVVMMGLEHGLADAWPFVLLLGVCLLQAFYPTVLGWLLIFIPFATYTMLIAVAPTTREPIDEYLLFVALSALPTCLLWWLRPGAATS